MEKKSKKAAEVKMAPKQEETKLTYDQLEEVAGNLNQQCSQLYAKLKEAQEIIANFNMVGMLLDIMDKAEYFNEDFVSMCTEKIQTAVTEMLKSDSEPKEN